MSGPSSGLLIFKREVFLAPERLPSLKYFSQSSGFTDTETVSGNCEERKQGMSDDAMKGSDRRWDE
jgi:hypothetical protein